MTKEEVQSVLARLAGSYGMSIQLALIATILLMLKGAASAGAPKSMEIPMLDPDTNQEFSITKNSLINAAEVAGIKPVYLRRLAEALALEIGKYAQAKGLSGDIANTINRRLMAKNEIPLTPRERAWASSFSQNLPNLDELAGSERLTGLLMEDYMIRFSKQKPSTPPKETGKTATKNTKAGKPAKEKVEADDEPSSAQPEKSNDQEKPPTAAKKNPRKKSK